MKVLYASISPIRRLRRAQSMPCMQPARNSRFDERQIVIVSGEPHEGYDFADSHLTSRPYRWAVLGGAIGGAEWLSADHADPEVISDSYRRNAYYTAVDQRNHHL